MHDHLVRGQCAINCTLILSGLRVLKMSGLFILQWIAVFQLKLALVIVVLTLEWIYPERSASWCYIRNETDTFSIGWSCRNRSVIIDEMSKR